MNNSAAVLVAFNFPPLNVVASQRAARMARELLNRYDHVYVLRLSPEGLSPSFVDPDYSRDLLEHPNLHCIDVRPLFDRRGFSADQSLIHRVAGSLLIRVLCSPGADWIPSLNRALAAVPESLQVKVVIATGPPFVSFISALRWADGRSAPTILDYRDLWSRNPVAKYPKLARALINRWLERPINRAATIMTTVSEGCRDVLLRDDPGVPIRLLMNVPDLAYCQYFESIAQTCDPASAILGDGVLNITFTGQVYEHCTFAPLLRAISQLADAMRRRVMVHYYGSCSEMVVNEFKEHGLRDCLNDHGMVPKEAAIRALYGSHILLSLVHASETAVDPSITGLVTTKIFDYLLVNKPIFNIGPPEAELNRFARQIGCQMFHSFISSDIESMTVFLKSALNGQMVDTSNSQKLQIPDFGADFNRILDEVEIMVESRF